MGCAVPVIQIHFAAHPSRRNLHGMSQGPARPQRFDVGRIDMDGAGSLRKIRIPLADLPFHTVQSGIEPDEIDRMSPLRQKASRVLNPVNTDPIGALPPGGYQMHSVEAFAFDGQNARGSFVGND